MRHKPRPMNHAETPLDAPSTILLIKWAEMAVRSRVEKALRPLRLSSGQLMLLVTIERSEEETPAALSRALHLTPQAMTTLLRPLDERGLIARRADETNRRRVLLSLTDDARALLRKVRALTPAVEKDCIADALDAREISQLRTLLMRIAVPAR